MKNKVSLAVCAPSPTLYDISASLATTPQVGEAPLGVLYIAGELERRGHEVSIFDNFAGELALPALVDEILKSNPRIVGFSVNCLNALSSRLAAIRIKKLNKKIFIVFGGPQVTLMPKAYVDDEAVDLLVTHEGELTLGAIADELGEENPPPLRKEGKIVRGLHPGDLDALPRPARHLVDMDRYRRKSYVVDVFPTDSLCSSRGCPFECAFCSSKTFWERRYYTRSASSVVDEIQFLVEEYGSKGIYFREDNFTVSDKHVRAICQELVRRKLPIRWECESRVDTLRPGTLEIMKEAGCDGLWVGAESGSPGVLKSIAKGITPDQIRSFFASCRGAGIQAGACFMIGFPDETEDDIFKTFDLAYELPAKWRQFVAYVGFPKSEVYDAVIARSLWENRWEDIYISGSESFTRRQLVDLEKLMNGKRPFLQIRDEMRELFSSFKESAQDVSPTDRIWMLNLFN